MRAPVLLALIALLIGGASAVMQVPLPGDVAITRALQLWLSNAPGWAGWLTDTARAPLLWGTLAVAGLLAWRIGRARAALAVPFAYGLAFAADKALRAVIFVPRPHPDWVAVAAPADTSGLPSTFGLVYGAMFGAALLARGGGRRGWLFRLIAAVLVIVGLCARIVLGGHWPSQTLASAALGLLLAWTALAVIRSLPLPRG
jgi:membrane-associated phospholipid phosphatase